MSIAVFQNFIMKCFSQVTRLFSFLKKWFAVEINEDDQFKYCNKVIILFKINQWYIITPLTPLQVLAGKIQYVVLLY